MCCQSPFNGSLLCTDLWRKALTDSGLGSEVIGGGLSDELSQATYAAGLKGVKPEDADKVCRSGASDSIT